MGWSLKADSRHRRQTPSLPDIPADPLRFAESILHFHPDEYQRQIFDPSIRRGLLCCTRQFGKSTCVSALTLHTALTNPGSLSLVLGPQLTHSGEFLRKIEQHLPALNIVRETDGIHRDSFLFPNGSRIISLTDTERAVRSYTAKLVVVDEAADVDERAIKAVKASLATTNGNMWLLSTPRGRTGYFYKAWTSTEMNWFRLRVTADQCPRISPEFLAEERIDLGEAMFAQEYMCEFSSPINAVFDDRIVTQALIDDKVRPDVLYTTSRFYLGLDLGKMQDPAALVISEVNDIALTGLNYITWEPNRTRDYSIRHIERMPLRTSYPEIIRRVKTLVNLPQYKDRITLVLDATGVGVSVTDFFKAADLGCPMMDVTLTTETKRDLIRSLQVMFDMRNLRIPKNLPELGHLVHELSAMRAYENHATGHIRYSAPIGEHDDLVIALALACWPARPHVPVIGEKGNRLF